MGFTGAAVGTEAAELPRMPFAPVIIIASLAIGIFVATLRLGRAEVRSPTR